MKYTAVLVFLMMYDETFTSETEHIPDSQWGRTLYPDSQWDKTRHSNSQWDDQLDKSRYSDSQWDRTLNQISQWNRTGERDSQWDTTPSKNRQWEEIRHSDFIVANYDVNAKTESVVPPLVKPTIQPTGRPRVQLITHSEGKRVSHPVADQLAVQPTSQSPSQSISQSEGQPTRKSAVQPTSQSAVHPASQSIKQLTSHSNMQSTRHSDTQPNSQPACIFTSQSISQPTSQSAMESTGHSSTKASSQSTVQHTRKSYVKPNRQSAMQPISQSAIQPTSQSAMHSTKLSAGQFASKSAGPYISQSAGHSTSKPAIHPTRQLALQSTSLSARKHSSTSAIKPYTRLARQPTNQSFTHSTFNSDVPIRLLTYDIRGYSVVLPACTYTQSFDILLRYRGTVYVEGELQHIHTRLCHFKIMALDGRFLSVVPLIFHLRGGEGSQTCMNLTITGGKTAQHLNYCQESEFEGPFVIPSVSSELLFSLRASAGNRSVFIRLDTILSNGSAAQNLRTSQLSTNSWSVTPIGFDGDVFIRYAHNTDAVFHVHVTETLVSFPHFDLQDSPECQADKLTLFKLGRGQGDPEYIPLWSHCGERYIAPQVYSHPIAIRFISDGSVSRSGFKMLYSIHPMSQVPQQLDSGLFSCSVSHYPTFQLHFHCNLETECEAGEDEAHCPYTSTDCGAGNIDAGNKCYRYITMRRYITWYDANEQCRNHGERLVSLRSLVDCLNLTKTVLHYARNSSHVLVASNMHFEEFQDLFTSVLMQNDSVSSLSNISDNVHCTNINTLTWGKRHNLILCDDDVFVHFVICERDKQSSSEANTTSTALDDSTAVRMKPQANFHQVDINACNTTQQSIHVANGTIVEVSLVKTQPADFFCDFHLVANRRQFVATVVETFRVQKDHRLDAAVAVTVMDGISSPNNRERLFHKIHHDELQRELEHGLALASRTNIISYSLKSSGVRHVYLRLRVLVTDLPGIHLMPHVQTQPNGGFLTSFAFGGLTGYVQNTNVTFQLGIPTAHEILISFRHFDLGNTSCSLDILKLVEFDRDTGNVVFERTWCGREDIPPLTSSHPIRLVFKSDLCAVHPTGFKMLYSIHPVSEVPQQLDSGLFNCSVPHYPTFQLHFHCNLETECVSGEDEAHCPYTSTDCGAGNIDAGNKCYRYVTMRRAITVLDATERCNKYGENVVSPRTPSEWNAFTIFLGYGVKTFGVFVSLRTSSYMDPIYRGVWQWEDMTMAFNVNARGGQVFKPMCAYVPAVYNDALQPIKCDEPIYVRYVLCERDKASDQDGHTLNFPDCPLTAWTSNRTVVHCPKGHVTHDFLSCDFFSDCGLKHSIASFGPRPLTPLCVQPSGLLTLLTGPMATCTRRLSGVYMPMFACDHGFETVHYTLVCNYKWDCTDGSDESWCEYDECPNSYFYCNVSPECVRMHQLCVGLEICVDMSEKYECVQLVSTLVPSVPPPAVVSLDGRGGYTIRELDPAQLCPLTHFRCSQHDYCLPVYLRCNSVYDCMGREDEAECDSYKCPGFYRCRASSVCVHSEHMCDGVFHCPMQDDEWLCDVACPRGCRCQGLAFICSQTFAASSSSRIRYLDAGGSGMTPRDLEENRYLVRLSLSQCGLTTVDNMTFRNLRWLDLSGNAFTSVTMQMFASLKNLRVLRLAGNPMTSLLPGRSDRQHINLHTLDLSGTQLVNYDGRTLAAFPMLTCLNISHGALSAITAEGFTSSPNLQMLDVRGSPLDDFPSLLLRQLASLDTVYASNFKLCCPAALPKVFDLNNCYAPMDEIVSCDDLLRSNDYRDFLWIMATMTIAGNAGSLAARVLQGQVSKSGFHVFVTNLCVADLLMGVYLIIIGGADLIYRGHYLWNDKLWRGSVACQVAGVLSLLSNEMSSFFICLITLDRFIALRFPLSDVRFRKRSALVACAVAWMSGFLLALVPLLPMTSEWAFYSQTGICIPLPITRATFGGGHYSFGVMVVLNFVLFVLIALGQALVFLSVRKNSIEGTRREQDLTIARRLTTVVLSDFLCWFPIGLLWLLAATGTPIPSDLNVGVVIFVLPLNSALNPFLYTINVIMEKRRKTAEARLLTLLSRSVGGRDQDKNTLKTRSVECKETQ